MFVLKLNNLCISERFNKTFYISFLLQNILVNSKHKNSNSKRDFVFKTSFERLYSRFLNPKTQK